MAKRLVAIIVLAAFLTGACTGSPPSVAPSASPQASVSALATSIPTPIPTPTPLPTATPAATETAPIATASPGPKVVVEALPDVLAASQVTLRWRATPRSRPVISYEVRYQRTRWDQFDFEPGVTVRTTAETKMTVAVEPGYHYFFEVRARDAGGALSDPSEAFTTTSVDDRSLAKSAGWTELSGSSYYWSTALRSSTKGATLTLPLEGIGVWLVATKCPTCGTVRVSLERPVTGSGEYAVGPPDPVTVSLRSSRRIDRKIIPLFYDDTDPAVSGTLTIKVVPTGKPVIIDGVVIY